MAQKNALRLRLVEVIASAGLGTLKTGVVPPDQTWCLQRVAYEGDKDTLGGNVRARLYKTGHGYNHYLDEIEAPDANQLYWGDDVIWLTPGEQLALEWDQAQAATTLKLFADGYWVPSREGV